MITTERMAAVDRNAAALGVPSRQLMEAAGHAIAAAVEEVSAPDDAVAVVAGRGSNGGDALVAARVLGDRATVHLLGRPATINSADTRANWEALTAAEAATRIVRDSRDIDLGTPDVVVDGILGTGVTGAPHEPEATAIRTVNEIGRAGAMVIAVDVPSGVDADTGETPGDAVTADRTITLHDRKPGLADVDDVTVADIGIPPAAELFVGPGDLLALDRRPESHKGDHGHVLVVGGGPYTGAPVLAALAALRAGADLVTVAAPAAAADVARGASPDLIVRSLVGERLVPDHVDELAELASARDAVVLGPGLGEASDTQEAVGTFLEAFDGPVIVDADALAVVPTVRTAASLLCTPHQGELEEMGGPTADDWRDRADAVEAFAAELGHALLVKGAYDVISDGDRTRVNRTGNPGMTVGGTGDVLAGVAGAIRCRRDPLATAGIAAFVTGTAGDRVAERHGDGLIASDLLEALPGSLREGTYG